MHRCSLSLHLPFTVPHAPKVRYYSSSGEFVLPDLAHKVAIVTGASRGIGRAIAHTFAAHGASVVLLSRNVEALEKLREALPRVGDAQHRSFAVDVSKSEEVENVAARIIDACEHVDVLVNSAGINRNRLLVSVTDEDIEAVISTNLYGTMYTCKALLPQMIRQKSGCIINVGSVVGVVGNSGQTVYSASKSALTGFTKSLAREVASRGIRVNMIVPGFIDTDMTRELSDQAKKAALEKIPLGRFGRVEEIAQTAKFLVMNQYITAQSIVVDGGLL